MALEDTNTEPNEHPEETPPVEESSNRTFVIVAGIIGAILLISIVCLALYALIWRPRQVSQQATQVAALNSQKTQEAIGTRQAAEASRPTSTATATAIPDDFQGVIEYVVQLGDTLESLAERFNSTADAIRQQNEEILQDAAALVPGRTIVIPVNILVLPPTTTPAPPSPTVGLPSPTIDRTGTIAALLTDAAAGKLTGTPTDAAAGTPTVTPTASALPTTGFAEDVGVPGLFGIALIFILLIFLARRLRTSSS